MRHPFHHLCSGAPAAASHSSLQILTLPPPLQSFPPSLCSGAPAEASRSSLHLSPVAGISPTSLPIHLIIQTPNSSRHPPVKTVREGSRLARLVQMLHVFILTVQAPTSSLALEQTTLVSSLFTLLPFQEVQADSFLLPVSQPPTSSAAHSHSEVTAPNTQEHILPRSHGGHTQRDLRRIVYKAIHRHHTILRTNTNQGTKSSQ